MLCNYFYLHFHNYQIVRLLFSLLPFPNCWNIIFFQVLLSNYNPGLALSPAFTIISTFTITFTFISFSQIIIFQNKTCRPCSPTTIPGWRWAPLRNRSSWIFSALSPQTSTMTALMPQVIILSFHIWYILCTAIKSTKFLGCTSSTPYTTCIAINHFHWSRLRVLNKASCPLWILRIFFSFF